MSCLQVGSVPANAAYFLGYEMGLEYLPRGWLTCMMLGAFCDTSSVVLPRSVRPSESFCQEGKIGSEKLTRDFWGETTVETHP